MRVAHLVPAMEEGGVESVVLSLARTLQTSGHSALVFSRGGRLVPRLEALGARHVAVDLKSKNPLTFFARARRLRRLLRDARVDLVCVHSRVPAWLFAYANRALRLPVIAYAHGANSVSRYSEIMTRGNRVVVPSQFLQDYLLQNYSDPTLAARIRIVPNAVDFDRFDPEAVDRATVEAKRREWGLVPGERVTMSVGRITALKGFDAVIRDFAARKVEGKLVIVGSADRGKDALLGELKSLARDLGLADRVVFAGRETMVPECLSIADEVVSGNTKKPESFGLSVVEAYAMNKPVRVLRSFGGVAEIQRAVEALQCPSLREAVKKLYHFDVLSQKTIQVYQEVLS